MTRVRFSRLPLLAVLMTVFALLAGVTTVLGNIDDKIRHSDQNSQLLPLLSNRHDHTLGPPVFGVQMYGSTGPSGKFYGSLVDSGATWLRVSLNWRMVEPVHTGPASYDWTSADQALAAAQTAHGGFSLVVTIGGNPDWATPYVNGPIDPDYLDDFAAFVQAAVERYDGDGLDDAPGAPRVTHWEFYNEPDDLAGPNVDPHWGGEGDQYAQMLAAVYAPVKTANPDAKVLLGGIAYDWFYDDPDDPGHFDRRFLDDVLNAGGGDYFDIMNFHVYPIFWYNWTENKSPGLLEKAQFLKDKLASYGYPNKPFVVTEAGWHSNAPGDPDGTDAGDPEHQARYVVELFTQNMASGSELMIWWMLYDPGGSWIYDNGLVTDDTPPVQKPAFSAFQVAVAQLGTAHFVRILPIGETGSSNMEAFEFRDNVHQRTLYVAWLDPVESANVEPLQVAASVVTVRDIYGDHFTVSDGQDGQVDGKVTVLVGGQPVYVEVNW